MPALKQELRNNIVLYQVEKGEIELVAIPMMPSRCTICGKGFHVKNRWMDHMNTHTGARPYDCMFCDKNFASHANMFKHLREAHAAQWKLHRENAKNKIK